MPPYVLSLVGTEVSLFGSPSVMATMKFFWQVKHIESLLPLRVDIELNPPPTPVVVWTFTWSRKRVYELVMYWQAVASAPASGVDWLKTMVLIWLMIDVAEALNCASVGITVCPLELNLSQVGPRSESIWP